MPALREGGEAARRDVHALRPRARLPGRRASSPNRPHTRVRLGRSRVPRSSERGFEQTMMRAVDAIMECLKAEGVDVVFGYPGGANLPTYDAMYDSGIRHILVRHEAGGGHAAEGYAKASGKVGVCFATSGPGATNIVTPLTDAMMDSVPGGLLHRPGPHGPARDGRLPGGGHVRHDHADRQALVHDPAPDGDPARGARGLPHRPHRAARAGADRHADGPHAGRDRLRAGRRRAPARLPADDRGQPEADPARREGAGQRAAAGALRRRRRDQRQRLGGAARARVRRQAAR